MAEIPKTSWADDVDDIDQPKIQETVDANGVRTIVEYTTNEKGKKVKITRRIERVSKKLLVNPHVAERKTWAKFGAEKGSKPGPDKATTTVGENVTLKLTAGNKSTEPEPDKEVEVQRIALAGKKILCRICKGDHFTSKCPYKDTLEPLGMGDTLQPEEDGPADTAPSTSGAPAGGKYIPPGMRAGGSRGPGESMFRSGTSREDLPTLRVTNVSEDATDDDLRELFARFGRVVRVYIGRDRETGVGKGYAFVSFEEKAVAEKAMQTIHGKGYDSLILNCQWSQPREHRN